MWTIDAGSVFLFSLYTSIENYRKLKKIKQKFLLYDFENTSESEF